MTVLHIAPIPRALTRASGLIDVRAAAEPKKPVTMDTLATAFEEFKAKHEARYLAIENAIDADAGRRAGEKLNGGLGGTIAPDPEYSGIFASYTRRGSTDAEDALKIANGTGERASIQAAMSEGDNSSGGYIAPVEWDRKVQKAQRALSPMRRLAQVVTTARAAYSTLWSNDQFGSGWVGEVASRPATSTNTFTPLIIPSGEIYANPAVTQRLLDDSAINLEEWLSANLGDEFSRQEGIAFVSGDGVNKPMGFLQYLPGGQADASAGTPPAAAHPGGNLVVTNGGHATLINNADAFVSLKYSLGAPYRQNATWLMNSSTAAVIAKLKDGQGNYIWREALLASEPATLLGRPVEIDENMPNVGANAFAVAFGDFARGYLVNDRVGVRILRDPYTNKPFVMFYATKRVGGGVLDPKAITVLKISA